jgi:predicted PurR-regulated permease PerM
MMYRTTLQQAFFLALLVLITLVFLQLIQDFLQPLFWATTFAILFHPVYQRWLQALGGRASLVAALTLLVIIVIVLLPLGLIGLAVSQEAVGLYQRIETGQINLQEPIRAIESAVPMVREYLGHFGIDTQRITQGLTATALTASQFLASQALNIGQNALRFSIMFALMLYLLFFFLRDGRRLVEALIYVLPFGDSRERHLLAKFAEVSRATLKGTLVVGIVQGALGGCLFWILGISAAVFWGVIMTVLSFLPAVGSAFIWVPAALIFFVTGHIVKGIVLIGVGVLVIGLVDNFLRPMLVGRDTSMPDYLILLSTLGGITVFGVSGFVIGPIIAALFLAVWEMFAREHHDRDTTLVVPEAMKNPKEIGRNS